MWRSQRSSSYLIRGFFVCFRIHEQLHRVYVAIGCGQLQGCAVTLRQQEDVTFVLVCIIFNYPPTMKCRVYIFICHLMKWSFRCQFVNGDISWTQHVRYITHNQMDAGPICKSLFLRKLVTMETLSNFRKTIRLLNGMIVSELDKDMQNKHKWRRVVNKFHGAVLRWIDHEMVMTWYSDGAWEGFYRAPRGEQSPGDVLRVTTWKDSSCASKWQYMWLW